MFKLLIFIFALFPFLYGSGLSADDDIFLRLLKIKCLKCKFKEGVTANWQPMGVEKKSGQWQGDTVFDSIDLKKGKARIIGNQGASDVIVTTTPSGITFIETTGFGNMVFTTVFPLCKPGTNEFYAVMSRHMNLTEEALPSQYYGTCKAWE